MQGVAGTERIHRADGEHRYAAQRAGLEEQNVVWPVTDRKERAGLLRDPFQRFGQIAAAGRCPQALGGKHNVRGEAE